MLFKPGIYRFRAAEIKGTVTLDAEGDKNARFIFIFSGDVNFQNKAQIRLKGNAQAEHVIWQANGSVIIGKKTAVSGLFFAAAAIHAAKDATVTGQLHENYKNMPAATRNSSWQNARLIGPDLQLTKTTPQFNHDFGDTLTFTIKVKNVGTTTESGAYVLDILPVTFIYLSSTTSNGNPFIAGSRTWNLKTMAPGDSATLTITVRINGGGFITNIAYINLGPTRTDVNPGNNTGASTICAAPPKPGVITGPPKVCIGDSAAYSVKAEIGVSFSWAVPVGWTLASGQGTNSVVLKPGTDTTTAYLRVQAITTCGESSLDSIRITPVQPVDSLSAITGDTAVCENATGILYTVANNPHITDYVWTVPQGWIITAGQGTDSITVSASPIGGIISVYGMNYCGITAVSNLPVNIKPLPPLPVISPPFAGEPCIGQTGLIYTIDSLYTATQYTWIVPPTWVITAGQNTDSLTVTAGTVSGVIKVYGANSCGTGDTAFYQVTVASQVPPPPPAIAGETLPCITSGFPYTYSIPAQSGVSTYNWIVPAAWTIVSGQQTESVTINFGSSVTTDTLKVNVTNGCGKSVNSILVITPQSGPPPAIPLITANPAGDPCIGQTIVYSITGLSSASSYNWTVPADWVIISGQGTTSISATAGTIIDSVYVQAVNSCGPGPVTTLAVNPLPAAPVAPAFISGNPLPCVGVAATYCASPTPNALGYTWSIPTGWTIVSGQGSLCVEVLPAAAAGSISVSAFNNCGTSQPVDLSLQPVTSVPGPAGPITGDTALCPSQASLFYSVSPVPNASGYNWTLPQGWVITSGQGTNVISVGNVVSAGYIKVAATNGCGAGTADSIQVSLTNSPPGPANAINGQAVPCIGSTAVYTTTAVPGATYYIWNIPAGWTILSGDSTLSITVTVGTAPGNITVTPLNNCGTGPFSTSIVSPSTTAQPAVGAITGSTFPCTGQTGVTYSIAAVPGSTNYAWTVPAGWAITSAANSNSIQVTAGQASGQVQVTVSNICGSASSQFTVTPVLLPPASSGTITGPSIVCTGLTYTFTASGAANADTYAWTFPAGWQAVSGQGTSTFKVKANASAQSGQIQVTAANGCGTAPVSGFTVNVSNKAPVLTGAITGPMKICLNDGIITYEVPAVANAATYTWTFPAGWQLVSGQGTNTLQLKPNNTDGAITVEASNDCGKSATLTIPVVTRTVPVITGKVKTENLSCTTRRYSITAVPGTTDYFWQVPAGWVLTAGQGTTAIEVITAADTGSVTVKAQNDGCASVAARLHVTSDISVSIPNAFSPNNDGINDVWTIGNLENYPDNEVAVINRWGNEVYRQKNYQGTWVGKDLSAGTYYYILRVKLCDGVERTFKGFIMLVK